MTGTRLAVAGLIALQTCALAYSAYVHSPTLNEPGHLVAGISHWKFERFELYRVNPPLVRLVAALPVVASGYAEDWSMFTEGPGARPVFVMGRDFVAVNRERCLFLMMIARWACLPFAWLGAIICYLWARDLHGRNAGLLACTLWCLSPNILGHASLITADAHAASLGLAACYVFWCWLRTPAWWKAALAGAVLGLAELAKTTLILFYPLWPVLWLAYRWPDRRTTARSTWLREAAMLTLVMTIGLYVLNLGYGFEETGKPLGQFHFVSDLFTGASTNANTDGPATTDVTRPHNRFDGAWPGQLPVPFPKNYVLGMDIQQSDFESYGHPSYLAGTWQDRGWWYYYLYGCAIKVPLGIWGLAVLAFVRRFRAGGTAIRLRDEMILLVPGVAIFMAVSAKTGFSEHLRYVLPCFPFAFVWISGVARRPSSSIRPETGDVIRPVGTNGQTTGLGRFAPLIVTGICWCVSSSLWVYPHSLSYFSEVVGGPANGHRHLLHSNIDWGQDLRYLEWWLADHASEQENRPLHLAYFGYYSPGNVGLPDTRRWPTTSATRETEGGSQRHTEEQSKVRALPDGRYAISVTLLAGYPWSPRSGEGVRRRLSAEELAILDGLRPIGRAGYSIRIYDVAAATR